MTSPFQATWLRSWWCSQRDPCGNSWMTGPGTLCSPLQYSMLVQLCITFVSVSLLGLSMFIKPEELSRSTQSVHAGSSWIMLDHAVVSSLIGQADRLTGWTWLKLNSAVPMGQVTRGKVLPNFVTTVRVRVPQGRGREPKGSPGCFRCMAASTALTQIRRRVFFEPHISWNHGDLETPGTLGHGGLITFRNRWGCELWQSKCQQKQCS